MEHITLLVIAASIVLTGCVTSSESQHKSSAPIKVIELNVTVDYLASPSGKYLRNSDKTYILKSLSGEPEYDLRYKQRTEMLAGALTSIGLKQASSFTVPDMVIYYSFRPGEAEKVDKTVDVPIYGQTGISSSRTIGTISSTGMVSATTTHTPTHGIVGQSSFKTSYHLYSYGLRLEAFKANSPPEKPEQIWQASIIGVGRLSDTDRAFKGLLYAAKMWLGVNDPFKCPFTRYEDCVMWNSLQRPGAKPTVSITEDNRDVDEVNENLGSLYTKRVMKELSTKPKQKDHYQIATELTYPTPSDAAKLKAAEMQANYNCDSNVTAISYTKTADKEEYFNSVCADGRKYVIRCDFSSGKLNISEKIPKLDRQLESGGGVIGSVNACWIP